MAAFVAGTAFTAAASWVDEEVSALDRTEGLSELLGFAVWLVFGVAALPLIQDQVGWRELLFAVLSLTVFRMVPVAVSLIGSGLRARSVAFIGWFGPRGLATVVFALLAVEDLEVDDSLRIAISTLAMTVLLSVILHGLSAEVFATRYGAWVDRERPVTETAPATEPRARRSLVPRWHRTVMSGIARPAPVVSRRPALSGNRCPNAEVPIGDMPPTNPRSQANDSDRGSGRFGRRESRPGIRHGRGGPPAITAAGDRGRGTTRLWVRRRVGPRPALPAVLVKDVNRCIQQHVDDIVAHEKDVGPCRSP